jgi:hypothetical protein
MTQDELSAIAAAWTRVGACFTVAPSEEPVDLESLVVTTARAAPWDARLFVVAASWLATHHVLVDGHRLALLASALRGNDTQIGLQLRRCAPKSRL